MFTNQAGLIGAQTQKIFLEISHKSEERVFESRRGKMQVNESTNRRTCLENQTWHAEPSVEFEDGTVVENVDSIVYLHRISMISILIQKTQIFQSMKISQSFV